MTYYITGYVNGLGAYTVGCYTDAPSIGKVMEELRLKGCTEFKVRVQ